MTKEITVDEVASRGPGKESFLLFKKMRFHREAINFYQPFDKCRINWFNTIKHRIAHNDLNGMLVSTDL